MNLKVIKTEAEYEEAVKEFERLMDLHPVSGSVEDDQLELLFLLIKKYDDEHFYFDLPDPISAIKFVMEQRDLKRKDLEQYIGVKSKISEVLSGKRPLSLRMIRALNKGLGIPADVLLTNSVRTPNRPVGK